MTKGKLIIIEGCDGCGKSTLIKNLKSFYKNNPDIIFVKEPAHTKFGESIFNLIKSNNISEEIKMHLFCAERLELLDKVIIPALEAGKTVISERFALSTWAYQCSKDNTLIPTLKSILNSLKKKVNVDATIYFRAVPNDVLDESASVEEKTNLGHLLLWYSVALQAQEFPNELLGEIFNLDTANKASQNFELAKVFINGRINSQKHNSDCGLASGEETI